MASDACILCGAPPPLTAEHIWPDWYNRQQPKVRYELESTFDGKSVQRRAAQALNLKPKVLCQKCNGNWGSNLETRVGPILTPMIRGQGRPLTRAETQLVGAWFVLKAMAAEYVIPAGTRPRQFFELKDGKHLKATLRPPEGSRIWIGRYVGTRATAGWITDRSSARVVSDDPRAGVFWHSVTYSIGQVLLHLFATSRPIALDSIRNVEERRPIRYVFEWAPGEWDTALTAIWPTPSLPVAWPPQKAFDDDAFRYLADRWQEKKAGP